ncbi:helical backbone metal receptor [Solimonas flava]|uniref:helical backbone metal receptor n=1 Tax=Solimonas flava TaxID=415849 RepID=UPI00040493B3|nr:helical backbone metal receptor [Solimonas flava]
MRAARVLAGLLLGLIANGATASERIVALAPHLAELVCAVGACDDLVGVVAYTDAPPAAARLPQVGSAFAVNVEAVLALRPSLVLAWGSGTPAATVERLRGVGLRVETVSIGDLDAIGTELAALGRRLGHADVGRAAAGDYARRLAALRERYRGRSRLRVFYQLESGPVYTINGRSPISAALSLCGGDNVFAALPTISAVVSDEAVLAADPDAVVVADDEDLRGVDAYWRRLAPARAADPARRVVVDAHALTRQSPRVLDGIAQLCTGLDRVRRDAR